MNGRDVLSSRRISPAWRGHGSGAFVCGGVVLTAAVLFFLVWRTLAAPHLGDVRLKSHVSLSATTARNAVQRLGNLGWVFEPNVGQTATSVKFLARANDANVLLTDDSIDISWSTSTRKGKQPRLETSDSLQLEFSGSARGNRPVGQDLLPGKTNYFIGRNPSAWHTNIPHYAAVRYSGLYPGVDAKFYGGTQGLEYDLTAADDSDLRRILMRVRGADAFYLNSQGDLMMRVGSRHVVMKRPRIYQLNGAERVNVSGGYRITNRDVVGFTVGKHRTDLPLVIDPAISVAYTSFLGGNGTEKGNSVAVDSSGDIYVGGTTTLPLFPETATLTDGLASGNSTLFVAKIDPSQTGAASLLYLTFVGGSGNDQGGMVALDNSATPPNLAILGWTTSTDFPVTNPANVLNGPSDLTITDLNGNGNALVYSEYFGGSGAEATQSAGGITTDAAGDVFITSDTASTDFPVTLTTAFQPLYGGGGSDGVLAEFAAGTGTLSYATYFGINASKVGATGVAVDSSGNAYVAGFTSSPTTFPTVNPFQGSYGGGNSDGFVMEINPAPVLGSPGLIYASLLGGSQADQALSISVDTSSPADAYVTGLTQSLDLIPSSGVTNAPFQASLGTGATQNGFFAVISQSGGVPALQYITYLGGSSTDMAQGVKVISPTQVYVTGSTTSSNFPSICSLQGFTGTQDAFLAQFNPSVAGTASLLGTTFLGGTVTAEANAVSADSLGNAIIFGDTVSPDFPLAGNPNTGFQPICTSCAATPPLSDAVLAKLTVNANASGCVVFSPSVANIGSFADGTTSPPLAVQITNDGNASLNVNSVTVTGPNSGDFSLTLNTCLTSSPVSPTGSCDLEITFEPSIIGPETASLQLSDDGIGSPQVLTLNGTGTGVGVTLSPGNTLSFPNTAQGQVSNPQSVTLTNTSTDNLNITQLPFQGTNPTDFKLSTSNTCASTASILAPGSACTIAVQFAPNEANPSAGGFSLSALDTLSVTDTVNNSTQAVTISVAGTELPATPAIVFAPTSLTFNSENVGTATAAQQITVTNTGSAPLTISSISIVGANAGDFPETNTCPIAPTTIAINGTCTIAVKFQPTGTGPRAASVSVSDNANSPQTVPLAGNGTAAGVTLTPPGLTFAGQNAGTPPSAPQTITLQNTGTGPLTISAVSITGANPGDFSETNNCPGPSATLGVGGACAIAVTFAPTGTGSRSASLTISDDAIPSPQIVSLNGTGTTPAAQLNVSSVAFGSVVVGAASASQPVQVSNTGNGPLVITHVGFSGFDPNDFQASGSCVGAGGSGVSVAAGSNCTVNVAFVPTAVGSRAASLSVTDNTANSPQQIPVAGTATDFQLGVGNGGATSATITAGETATFNLETTPVNGFTGTVAMSCNDSIPASTCTLSPQQVMLSGTQPVGFSVTVTTTARSALPPLFRRIPPRIERPFMIGLLLLALALVWLWNRTQYRRPRLRTAFLLAGALLLCSCGGGGSNLSSNGTPAGTYSIVATGTISGTQRTVNLTITVE